MGHHVGGGPSKPAPPPWQVVLFLLGCVVFTLLLVVKVNA